MPLPYVLRFSVELFKVGRARLGPGVRLRSRVRFGFGLRGGSWGCSVAAPGLRGEILDNRLGIVASV